MASTPDDRDLIGELAFVARLHSDSDREFARRIALACVELLEACPADDPKDAIRVAFDLND